jgi:hypothetical protein
VNSRNPKSDPQRKLSSRFGADLNDGESDDTTRRQPDPIAAAGATASGDPMIPIDEDDDDDDVPTTIREPAALDLNAVNPDQFTPPPRPSGQPIRPAKITPPPPPTRPARFDHANAFMPPPPLPPESPFDEFPPTPGPDPVFGAPDDGEPEFSSETPPPIRPSALPFPPPLSQPYGNLPPAPPLNFGGSPQGFGGGPPPGRPALPRPGGYLEPGYAANLHMPPAPPSAPAFDSGGNGFGGGFPETVDFGRNSAPVVVKRSGPPGFIVLLTLLAGAAGGAWLGEKVTHNAVAALDASIAAAAAKSSPSRPSTSSEPSIRTRDSERK